MLHLAEGGDPASGPTPPQVGFVVSRAVGNAVVRNRVRRRLRHLVRELLTDLPAGAVRDRLPELSVLPGGAVLVVRALPDAAGASYDELRGDLARCLERVLPRVQSPVQSQPAAHDGGAMVPR